MTRKLLLAALLLSSATGVNAATVVNGSFEIGPNPNVGPGFTTLGAGDSSITGWTVSAGTIDYIGNYWQAQDGGRSIDLAGISLGAISQVVANTVAGQLYSARFYVSKNPDGGAPTRTGVFQAGLNAYQFAYSLPNSTSNMNWTLASYRFIGTAPSTVISFAADPSGGCCFGPALDNVSIAAVPEPETWAMMIGGFALVGGALRMRRRTAKLATA